MAKNCTGSNRGFKGKPWEAADKLRGNMDASGHKRVVSMGPGVNAPYMDPDGFDRVVRKHALRIGLARDYSAPSTRATLTATPLMNGARFEDVQDAAGHAKPSTTRLYDKRGYDPEKSASFSANY